MEDGESDDDILPSVEVFPTPANTLTPGATIARPNNHPPSEIEVSENGVTDVPNDIQTTYNPHSEDRYIGIFHVFTYSFLICLSACLSSFYFSVGSFSQKLLERFKELSETYL